MLFAPKPTIPLLLPVVTTPPAAADDDDEDDAAAAAAANNNGFDVIVISRPELPDIDVGCVDAFDRLEDPPPKTLSTAFCREDDEDATGCGRRGNRSNC